MSSSAFALFVSDRSNILCAITNDEEFNSIVFEEYDEQYMYFFAIELVLLVVQMLIGERKVFGNLFAKN